MALDLFGLLVLGGIILIGGAVVFIVIYFMTNRGDDS